MQEEWSSRTNYVQQNNKNKHSIEIVRKMKLKEHEYISKASQK